jgi:hypothetical protein
VEIFNELARDLKGNTNKAINRAIASVGYELGTITSSGLKLDNFKYEIKDYTVLEYLKLNPNNFSSTTDELHSVATPNQLRPLASGDRVLVAAVSESDFIVVGRVTNA